MSPERQFFECEDSALSRESFDTEVRRIAGGMRSAGLAEGDTVALLMRNDAALAESIIAADLAGLYSVPLNWHSTIDELGYVLRDSQAKLLIAHTDLLATLDTRAFGDLRVVAVPTPAAVAERYRSPETPAAQRDQNWISWKDWLADQQPLERPALRARGSIIYTSGTTGKPKGVQREPYRDADAYQANLRTLHAAFGTKPGMRALITGPLYHGGPAAYWRAAYAACRDEGLVVLRCGFDAEEMLACIDQLGITHLFAVPTMFVRLLRLPESIRLRYDVTSLRHVVHTAAPCPADVKAAMNDWFADAVYEFYGTTETGPITVAAPRDTRLKPGTVGRILDGVTLRVIGRDGEELRPGQTGEICALNANYPEFTYRNRQPDRDELNRRGLIATGDIGHLDDDGYLFISDRAKDMVISGGVNIYPAEIEAALIGIVGVRDCAVFGIPHDEFGEALAAHVELEGGATLTQADIQEQLAVRLARFKIPSVVRFEKNLPREDNGKIYKRRLSDPYWKGRQRRI